VDGGGQQVADGKILGGEPPPDMALHRAANQEQRMIGALMAWRDLNRIGARSAGLLLGAISWLATAGRRGTAGTGRGMPGAAQIFRCVDARGAGYRRTGIPVSMCVRPAG